MVDWFVSSKNPVCNGLEEAGEETRGLKVLSTLCRAVSEENEQSKGSLKPERCQIKIILPFVEY